MKVDVVGSKRHCPAHGIYRIRYTVLTLQCNGVPAMGTRQVRLSTRPFFRPLQRLVDLVALKGASNLVFHHAP
ncbi:hypothetical protein ABRP17_011810 [Stenotrophomonas sp. WHRI 8082]|uniref:hypothetical protein n=1 Tax=Stenotrophomonas sp. WHRI 8082 TaxID=3162571 RepID=UPI0035589A18